MKLPDMLHIKYPIIQAGMAGRTTTPDLVAAVSNAGGLGILAATRLTPVTRYRRHLLKSRKVSVRRDLSC